MAAWVLLAIVTLVAGRQAGGTYADEFSLPNSPSVTGADLLSEHNPSAGGKSGQIVFALPDSSTESLQDHQDVIDASMKAVADIDHVLSATDPLQQVSEDKTVAYSTVQIADDPKQYGDDYVGLFDQATQTAVEDGIQVSYGGLLGQADRPSGGERLSEGVGILVAIVVLLIGFGSVYAAALPILTAVLGGIVGLSLLGLGAGFLSLPTVSPTLAIMMGLGVGIDYALFLSTRHRQQVMDGVDPIVAAGRSVATSGGAVLTAALTVVIALMGLYASGLGFVGKLGLAGSVGVAVAAAASLTLVPAMLAIAGHRIDQLKVRRPVAEPGGTGSVWVRYAESVSRRPWPFLLAGVVVVAIMAVPMLSMQLGHVDAGADPLSYSDKQAYDAIERGFGAGANGPLTIVVQPQDSMSAGDQEDLANSLRQDLAGVDNVASVAPFTATQDGALLVGTVIPAEGPQDSATDELVGTLQDEILPKTLGNSATGYVTGTLASQLQFRDTVAARLPLIIVTVIAASFLLLILAFRSPVLAVKAALMNLLSVGAAYGVIVAVFQWGWGGSLLGVSEKVPIESYIPMMMFAIVFGLSMDYEVFLLSRVRERWLETRDNTDSVGYGLSRTARVISCAALIMASVFFAFAASPNVVVKVLAVGLGVSVLIDAFVIRLLLVPSSMFLLGRANWWTPRWLDRVLGDFTLERPPLEGADG
ncbi:membrane protein [Kineosporia sp. NBRC 101731]|nr:membrane protein [Kineosporia sp. NBRC 101731]